MAKYPSLAVTPTSRTGTLGPNIASSRRAKKAAGPLFQQFTTDNGHNCDSSNESGTRQRRKRNSNFRRTDAGNAAAGPCRRVPSARSRARSSAHSCSLLAYNNNVEGFAVVIDVSDTPRAKRRITYCRTSREPKPNTEIGTGLRKRIHHGCAWSIRPVLLPIDNPPILLRSVSKETILSALPRANGSWSLINPSIHSACAVPTRSAQGVVTGRCLGTPVVPLVSKSMDTESWVRTRVSPWATRSKYGRKSA